MKPEVARRTALVTGAAVLGFAVGLASRPEPADGDGVLASDAPGGRSARAPSGSATADGAEGRRARFARFSGLRDPAQGQRRDPVALARLGIKVDEIFASEPRDESWAIDVESLYRTSVTEFLDELLPDATDLDVSCHSSSCRIQFMIPADRRSDAFALQQLLPLGDIVRPWSHVEDGASMASVGVVVLLGRELRDPSRLREHYEDELARRFPGGFGPFRDYIETQGLGDPSGE